VVPAFAFGTGIPVNGGGTRAPAFTSPDPNGRNSTGSASNGPVSGDTSPGGQVAIGSAANAPANSRRPFVTPAFSRRFGFTVLGAASLLLCGGMSFYLMLDRVATERQVLRQVGVLADTMAAQAGALLNGLDQTLLGLGYVASPSEQPALMAALLSVRENATPDGVVLAVLTPDGEVRLATQVGQRRIAGLQYGALAELVGAMPESQPIGQLWVGRPVRSVAGPLLPMLQRMEDGGIALALMPLRLVEGFYAGLDLQPGSSIALIDDQARLLARRPPMTQQHIGDPIPHIARLMEFVRRQESWSGRSASVLDGQSRYLAVRPVPGQPMAIIAGFRDKEAMAPWVSRAWLGAGLTLLAIATAAAGMMLVAREVRRRLRAQAVVTARLEMLAQGSAGIATTAELPALLGHVGRLARETLAAPYACVVLHGDEPSTQQHAITVDPSAALPLWQLTALEAWSTAKPGQGENDGEAPGATPRLHEAEPGGLPARANIALRDETGQPLGALCVAGKAGGFSADDGAMLAQLARLAEIAIRNRGLIAGMRRSAEEASSARVRIERLLESVTDCFVALDAAWCFTYANAAALRLMRRRHTVIGRSVWALYPALAELPIFAELHAVASRGQAREFEQHLERRQRWYHVNAFPAGDGIGVFFRDVTEQRQAQRRAQQSQRMEAVGQLTGGVAHDFNNLLAVIIGNAEMLEDDLAGDPARHHAASMIREAGERGADLVRHLLAFASHQPQVVRDVAPQALLEGLLPLLRRSVGGKVKIVTRIGGDLPVLRLDPGQVENAILNLAINARDAMPGGGILTLAMSAVELEPAALRGFPMARPGPFLRLDISDTGTGMLPDVLEQATEPFFSTKGHGRGAGLGLATVYTFATQNLGVLRLHSVPGQGTRVTLLLPRVAPAGTAPHAGAGTTAPAATTLTAPVLTGADAPPRGREHVLLVEDEAALRDSVTRQLRQLGYQVTALSGGPEAVAALDEGLRPDLLLSDVIMPGGISGPRLADLARQRLPNLPVLLMSGYALAEGAAGMAAGDAIIAKPCDSATLAANLRSLLDEATS
jgi:signal transduction histidine kinase